LVEPELGGARTWWSQNLVEPELGGVWHEFCVHSDRFCQAEAAMEADSELTTLIFGFMFAVVILVGLGAIASMIDAFKFAHGAFIFLADVARAGASAHSARRPMRSSGGSASIPRVRGGLPKPQ